MKANVLISQLPIYLQYNFSITTENFGKYAAPSLTQTAHKVRQGRQSDAVLLSGWMSQGLLAVVSFTSAQNFHGA